MIAGKCQAKDQAKDINPLQSCKLTTECSTQCECSNSVRFCGGGNWMALRNKIVVSELVECHLVT